MFALGWLLISCTPAQKEPTVDENGLTDKQKEFVQFVLDNSVAIDAKWKNPSTLEVTFKPDQLGQNEENYDDKLDGIYWKLVLHEGHRARQGAAMMGPSYFWSQGMQEVAERLHLEFAPEVEGILGRKADKFMRERGYIKPDF